MKKLFLVVLLAVIAGSGYSQDTTYKNEFGFQSDNDAYLAVGQDRYYTNGLFITFRRATDQSRIKAPVNKKIWEAEIGQKIYNPVTGRISSINSVDRPFAGYLYVGGSLHWLYQSESSLKITLQLGTLGPSALGEEVQSLLHDIVGFYEIRGWEFQLKDEMAINTSAVYDHLLGRSNSGTTDLTGTSYINIGNTFSGAGLGLLFRAGSLNKMYQSVSTNSRIAHNPKDDENKKELFFFLKPQLHFIAYNATVQGGLFLQDKGPVTFGIKPLVFSQEAGINYANNRWTLNFSAAFLTREIKSIARAHQYATAKIYYRFN
ncbi:MAG TPA: lipid A deacylase LpxR family protein [Sphingobacteriaceae bacterium]